MVLFTCNLCNFNSTKKSNYLQHMKTKKHRLNEINTLENNKNNSNNIQKHPENIQKHPEKYLCEYFEKAFTNFSNKRRHELHRCKYNNTKSDIVINQEKQIKMLENEMNKQRKEMEKQRKDLMRQIEVLLTKVGNNNTTITNNIQLNNYGNEDLSHITNNQKTKMLKMQYGMIPKMIESVHFDDNKPENRNIMIVNKKDKYIKIFKNGKWVYKDKKETLEDLIDGKYYILDEHYNEIPESELNELQRNRYKEFQTKYDSNDNELHKKLIEKTEITLLNQME